MIKKTAWMDSTDFEVEVEGTQSTTHPTEEDCRENHECIGLSESDPRDIHKCHALRVYIFDADEYDKVI